MSLLAVILISLSSSMIQPTRSWPAFTPSTTTTPTPSPSSCTTKWIIQHLDSGSRYSSRMLDRRRFLQALAALSALDVSQTLPARAQAADFGSKGGPAPANLDEIAAVLRQDPYDLELLISFGTSKG